MNTHWNLKVCRIKVPPMSLPLIQMQRPALVSFASRRRKSNTSKKKKKRRRITAISYFTVIFISQTFLTIAEQQVSQSGSRFPAQTDCCGWQVEWKVGRFLDVEKVSEASRSKLEVTFNIYPKKKYIFLWASVADFFLLLYFYYYYYYFFLLECFSWQREMCNNFNKCQIMVSFSWQRQEGNLQATLKDPLWRLLRSALEALACRRSLLAFPFPPYQIIKLDERRTPWKWRYWYQGLSALPPSFTMCDTSCVWNPCSLDSALTGPYVQGGCLCPRQCVQ